MTTPDPSAVEYDQEQAPLRVQRPSKAALKREWHQAAVAELEELGELYGVEVSVMRRW